MSLIVLGSENWSHQLENVAECGEKVPLGTRIWERVAARCSSRAMPVPTVLKAYDGVELFHTLHKRVGSCTDTRRVIAFIIRKGLWKGLSSYQLEQWMSCAKARTRHSLRVSTTRSPRTNPHPAHTRSPAPNSSIIVGLGSLQSKQMRRTERSGAKAACWGLGGEARGNGLGYIIEKGPNGRIVALGAEKARTKVLDSLTPLLIRHGSKFTRSRAGPPKVTVATEIHRYCMAPSAKEIYELT
jgi:hypothetical protein